MFNLSSIARNQGSAVAGSSSTIITDNGLWIGGFCKKSAYAKI